MGSILVFGPLAPAEAIAVRAAASAVGCEAELFDCPVDVASRLARERPVAVLVVWGCDGSAEVVAHLHGDARYGSVPVLGLAQDRTEVAFAELFRHGGDDLASPRSQRGLVARLRQLVAQASAPAPAARGGHAVVAGTSLRARTAVGRMLEHAGIITHFVNNAQDAEGLACSGEVDFVVAFDDLSPDGAASAWRASRAKGAKAPWIVLAPTRRAAAARHALERHPGIAVLDAYAPPDHVLFVANELLRPELAERRSSSRVLFGTAVSFRGAGAAEDDVGLTYNLSASGLFVRTLAPLEADQEVWLELWPPHTTRAVRLAGRVAWRRPFGPTWTATVPPGFGVALTGGLPGDLERWRAAHAALAGRLTPPYRSGVWGRLSELPASLAASTVE